MAEPLDISDSWISDFLYRNVSERRHPHMLMPNSSNHVRGLPKPLPAIPSSVRLNHRHLLTKSPPIFQAVYKAITWQGLADSTIKPNSTANCFNRVSNLYPNTIGSYRLFYVPGVGYCGGGPGPVSADAFGALRAWVDNGTAPDTLAASSASPINGKLRHESLCHYPLVSKYVGGDVVAAELYPCVESF